MDNLKKLKIFIVDDEIIYLNIFEQHIKKSIHTPSPFPFYIIIMHFSRSIIYEIHWKIALI